MSCLISSHTTRKLSQLTNREAWYPVRLVSFALSETWCLLLGAVGNSVCNTYTYHVDEAVIIPSSTCLTQTAPGMHHALHISLLLPALLLDLFLYSASVQVRVCVCDQ